MAGTSELFPAMIVIFNILGRVDSEYNYQRPGAPFQLPNQQYIQGRHPENLHYAQASPHQRINVFQKTYASGSFRSQYIQSGQFVNSQLASQKPSFVGSNYYQGPAHTGNVAAPQNVQQANLNGVNLNTIVAAPVQPTVMKHIYFHVAPPDVEASVAPTPIKRKKNYNIVFIKVPSQQPRYFTNAQGFTVNRYVPVEDKTVIYVLVKKPDDQLQGSAKSPPNHEVFYVKYKGSAAGAASQINNQLSEVTSAPKLRPGLVNGQT